VIIGAAQGGISPQIAARAQSEDAYYIGSYGDETKFAPDHVVTSVVADLRRGYEDAVDGWLNGDFSAEIHTEGVKEGTLKVTPLRLGFEDKQAEVDKAIEDLSSDSVEWPKGACAQR
jgi:basic membrane lipoprotein Med (substrate-binding protein (PBP1-ABC) superfamily)